MSAEPKSDDAEHNEGNLTLHCAAAFDDKESTQLYKCKGFCLQQTAAVLIVYSISLSSPYMSTVTAAMLYS